MTRLEIRGPGGVGLIDHSYLGAGIGWDDLSYEIVPAPAGIGLLGVAGLCATRRRRI